MDRFSRHVRERMRMPLSNVVRAQASKIPQLVHGDLYLAGIQTEIKTRTTTDACTFSMTSSIACCESSTWQMLSYTFRSRVGATSNWMYWNRSLGYFVHFLNAVDDVSMASEEVVLEQPMRTSRYPDKRTFVRFHARNDLRAIGPLKCNCNIVVPSVILKSCTSLVSKRESTAFCSVCIYFDSQRSQ
jgi:hypothetical protein